MKYFRRRIMVTEAYPLVNYTMMMYYGSKNYSMAHFPFNFDFALLSSFLNAKEFDQTIRRWLDNMPPGNVANWNVSSKILNYSA